MDNLQEQKPNKAWYKKWWVWAIVIVFIFAASNMGKDKNNTPAPLQPGTQTTPEKASPKPSEAPKQEAFQNTAEAKDLFAGDWEVGKDIKAGKYIFTTTSGSGNFFIYDKSGMPVTNEILTASEDGLGVKSVETYIKDGEKISISSLKNVKCVPADTSSRTQFTAGVYYVGREVAEGTYIATAPKGSGNFFVYDKSGMPVTNEILGSGTDNLSVDKVKVTLKNGYKMQINGLDKVILSAE